MKDYLSELEDGAAARFYAALEERKFTTTRCQGCDFTFFPPRAVCPRCLGRELEWVEPPGTGTLYAFTQQHQALAHTRPEVVGLVELDGVCGRVFSVIDAPLEELRIGTRVRVSFFQSPFGFIMHRFERA